MKPNYLDSFQRDAVNIFTEKGFLFLHGKKDSGKTYLLRHLINNAVLVGKRIIIVCESDQELHNFKRMMNASKLNGQVMVFDASEGPRPENFERLSVLLKEKIKDTDQVHTGGIDIELDFLREKILRYFASLNENILFDKSWHELVVLQAFDKHSRAVLFYNHILQPKAFKFTQKEYDSLLDSVVKGFDFYERQTAMTDDRFSVMVFDIDDAEKAWQIIDNWVNSARKRTLKTISSINHYLQKYGSMQRQKFIETTKSYKLSLEQYSLELKQINEVYDIELSRNSQGSIFNVRSSRIKQIRERINEILKHLNVLADDWNEMGSDLLSAPAIKHFSSSENLPLIIERISSWLDYFEHIRPDMMMFVRQKIDAININHTEEGEILKLEQEINNLYAWLNTESVLNHHFESTAFSLSTILNQLENIIVELNNYRVNPASFKLFYNWNVFYFRLDQQHRNLIDKLLIIQPVDWIAFFRNWYVQNILDLKAMLYQEDIDVHLHNYRELLISGGEAVQKNFLTKQQLSAQNILSENSSGRSKLRKYLSGKEQFPAWQELFDGYNDLISMVYPVMLTTFDSVPLLKDQSWDMAIFKLQHWDKQYVDSITAFINKQVHVVVSARFEESEEKIQAHFPENPPAMHKLSGNHLQSIIPLEDMNHTERLHGARNLAHIIQDINPEISIFHLEQYIIFSCLSNPLNAVLLQLLDQRGVKKMRVLESPFHLLVENLLEVNSPRFILTQDSLLSSNMESLDWQLFAIDRLKKAGLQIVDFKTRQLLSNPLQLMIKFTENYFPVEKG
jgi:hypothetical protein